MIGCCIAFLAAVVTSLVLHWSLILPLSLGLALFFLLGLRRGFGARDLCGMAWEKGRDALVVVRVLLRIGILTAVWRSCGTIAFCIYYGVRAVSPPLFILVAFLLTAGLSFALGTSFGVVGTAGVILVALARSGGVDPVLTAGVVLSGAYFGDRCSPASSCAALVAVATGTELYDNVRHMLRTATLPTVLTLGVYAVLSVRNPIGQVDEGVLSALSEGFSLSAWALLPVALMLVLPLLKVEMRWAMLSSIAAGCVLTLTVQGLPLLETLKTMVLGYTPRSADLAGILSGGGAVSMVEAMGVVLLTGLYAGILEGTRMLDPVRERVEAMAAKIGLFPATIVVSLATVGVFCNQSVMVLLDEQLLGKSYRDRGASRTEQAMDIANSGVVLAGLVPWSIALTIPLSVLGVGLGAVPYAVLLYAIPLCYLFTRKFYTASLNRGERAEGKDLVL